MLDQICAASFQQLQIFLGVGTGQRLTGYDLGSAAVHLEGTNGCDQNGAVRRQAAFAALDVTEFFKAHVGAESGLGDHVAFLAHQFQSDLVGENGGIAVSDVGKRSRVHKRGGTLPASASGLA